MQTNNTPSGVVFRRNAISKARQADHPGGGCLSEKENIRSINTSLKKRGLKKCYNCKKVKPHIEFYKRTNTDYRQGMCKSCVLLYYHKKWQNISPEKRSLRMKKFRVWYDQLRSEIIKEYNGKCACCGEMRVEFLSVDHINGGGTNHRKRLGGGTAFFQWLKQNNYPKDKYRLLCMNCNWARGRYGYCPHEMEANN